ncbi:hypothetical protein WMY93_020717 [Mugilogobius chulae]|uniref:Transcription factor IIIB 50 kDa subunit n=1 Tax=Mugilogobius chulae TaxID=88201 RepID=A0AAW0NDJ4_9GOBI
MPPAGLKCPGCGSSNVVEDALYAQVQLVCADCGSVVSEGFLVNDPVGGSDVSFSHSTQQTKRPCRNLIKGLQRLRGVCRVLRLNTEIEKTAQTYFEQVYNHQSFINVSLTKKELLLGSCVLIGCRIHNWPISVGTIAYLIDSDPTAVGPVYQETVKTLNIQVPSFCAADVMEAHCQEYKITSKHVSSELAADIKELTKRALALVELAAESWIVTGRRPVPIMMAATYLSWQSLQPTKLRLKTTLDKFCQIAEVDKNRPAVRRVSEIKETLCKLGNQIPWEKREVTNANVMPQVEDILNYRFALMRRAVRAYEESIKQREDEDEETAASESTEGKVSSETGSENVQTDADVACVEPNWGKRKRKTVTTNDCPDVTGDEDISDTEIESYIRSREEVRDMALTQKLLEKENDSKYPLIHADVPQGFLYLCLGNTPQEHFHLQLHLLLQLRPRLSQAQHHGDVSCAPFSCSTQLLTEWLCPAALQDESNTEKGLKRPGAASCGGNKFTSKCMFPRLYSRQTSHGDNPGSVVCGEVKGERNRAGLVTAGDFLPPGPRSDLHVHSVSPTSHCSVSDEDEQYPAYL